MPPASATSAEAPLTDARIHVAQLLKQPVGATRRYRLALDALALGEERVARDLRGPIKLTRIGRGLLVAGEVAATVELTCVRCLEEYTQPVTPHLEDEFRPTIDVTTGLSVPAEREGVADDFFPIGEDHVLDLSEALRQAVWLATPMTPHCREDCPGIPVAGDEAGDAAEAAQLAVSGRVDSRLAVLAELLDGAGEAAPEAPPTRGRRAGRADAR
jgi:uncharacterized protein